MDSTFLLQLSLNSLFAGSITTANIDQEALAKVQFPLSLMFPLPQRVDRQSRTISATRQLYYKELTGTT